jgi:cupin fold WbuC family metalloprotein
LSNALFNRDVVAVVDDAVIAELKTYAEASPQLRFRLCLHGDVADPVQEMVIVASGKGYMSPHRHPAGRTESYHVIEGELSTYLMDDHGVVTDVVHLGAPGSGKPCLYRLAAPRWHFTVARSAWVVFHEVFTGPHGADAVAIPSWAPDPADPEACAAYTRRIVDFGNGG